MPTREAQQDRPVSAKKPATVHTVPPVIARALIEIQRDLEPMVKTADNDAYGSKYIPLEDVFTKATELLTKKKIAVLQPMTTDEYGHAALETILVHYNGASFSRTSKLALSKVDPQGHGSAVTYTRRYALMSMIGLTAKNDDDDANTAAGATQPVTTEQFEQLKALMLHLKFPADSIAAELRKLRSRDSAQLAIRNFEQIVSQRMRQIEAGDEAAKIDVTEATAEDESVEQQLHRRIKNLGLANAVFEKQLVYRATGASTLTKALKTEKGVKDLDEMLTALETGKHTLPSEFYPPAKEPRVVNEDVA